MLLLIVDLLSWFFDVLHPERRTSKKIHERSLEMRTGEDREGKKRIAFWRLFSAGLASPKPGCFSSPPRLFLVSRVFSYLLERLVRRTVVARERSDSGAELREELEPTPVGSAVGQACEPSRRSDRQA
jgi:hypothetical protein